MSDAEVMANPNEAQTDDIAKSWVNGRIFRKTDNTGRMEVVIMNTDTKKIADHFFAEPGEDGEDVYTGISALRSLTGERIGERKLKETPYDFERGKAVSFNTITRDMELRTD